VPGCHPNCDCERFVELWNLVFMQYYQNTERARTPLPAPSVDTGMGLERAAVILQEKNNIYETDLFAPVIDKVAELSGAVYGESHDTDFAMRVVAEHARAASFLIGDGVVPGNEGRGYVLRRIIRRGIRYGRQLGLDGPFLSEVAEQVIARFQAVYRELSENHDFILRVVRLEEERFGQAIDIGLPILEDRIIPIHKKLVMVFDSWDQIVSLIPQPMYHTTTNGGAYIREELSTEEKLTVLVNMFCNELASIEEEWPEYIGEFVQELSTLAPFALEGLKQTAMETRLALEANLAGFTQIQTAEYRHIEELGSSLKNLPTPPADRIEKALKEDGDQLRNHARTLPGQSTFILYDTYGFPVELTAEIAREHGLEVDMEGFQREMEAQRQQSRSRSAQAFVGGMEMLTVYENLGAGETSFIGHNGIEEESVVVALLLADKDSGALDPVGHATQGQQVELVLGRTPFYAEGGGQLGDRGTIAGPNGTVRVQDTQSPVAGLVVQRGVVEQGDISLGDRVTARVDPARRMDASRNHSGTHLLHASLRSVLGPHVRQAGSLVAPDRLRFDFSHISAMSPDELLSVQSLSNEKVWTNLLVSSHETTYAEAVRQGALAFFWRPLRRRSPGGQHG
jgi:alanyl-tRNA synthetase